MHTNIATAMLEHIKVCKTIASLYLNILCGTLKGVRFKLQALFEKNEDKKQVFFLLQHRKLDVYFETEEKLMSKSNLVSDSSVLCFRLD